MPVTGKGEFINQRRDGVTYRESKTIAAIYDTKGSEQYYLAIGEDLSQRHNYQQKTRSLAGLRSIDWTTECAAFLNALNIALNNADTAHLAATVLHIDIDDFFWSTRPLGPVPLTRSSSTLPNACARRFGEAICWRGKINLQF